MKKLHFFIALIFLFNAKIMAQISEFQQILTGKSGLVDEILNDFERYELQLIYTEIDRDSDQKVNFKHHKIGVPPERYFYPASTVKLPAAILALEKLNELKIIGLNRRNTMIHGKARPAQSACTEDLSAMDSLASIEHYIKKIFSYSDNEAYNRLFEFLGVEYFNERLNELGIENHRIVHRVGISGFSYDENKYTNPVSFYDGDSLLYHQGAVFSEYDSPFTPLHEMKGKGYIKEGQLVEDPMDFSRKNFISLEALQEILQRIMFPQNYSPEKQFNLTQEDYNFLQTRMASFPRESSFPKVDYPDGYVKFFLYGGKEKVIPRHIRIFNKVGDAYGYLTDVAYIVDLKKGIEFILSGVIHVNQNQIYNDNNYEYEKIGLPFFKAVGEIIYEHEVRKKRNVPPNLTRYKNMFPLD